MSREVTTEKLMEDLRVVVQDAEALLKATAGQAGDRISEARARAEDSVRQARERLQGVEDDLTGQAKAAVRDADRYVRDNPWQAIGIAAGAGLLIGLLLGRK
jgi:ElaB/YqjD/DUF883 family membrane-anchored ribosome-binding protein